MSKSTRRLWSSATIISMGLIIALAAVAITPSVNAMEDHADHDHATTTKQMTATETTTTNDSNATDRKAAMDQAATKAAERREAAKVKAEERREAVREKLSAAKLKACEKRQANITKRASRIADRGTRHLELFSTIAEHAKTFYVNKGKTLANYDELVAAVDAKKAAAESAVATVSNDTGTFVCANGNPKDVVADFKANVQARNAALKEYRTAVKDLIVGIKSVNSTVADNKTTTEETE